MQQLEFIYSGGATKRFHTVETIKSQDIAAHSFGVAWLCELLTKNAASKNLIMAALSHDLAEHVVGDIPSPSKKAMGVSRLFHDEEMKHLGMYGLSGYLDDLAEGEELTLKLADMLDGMMFCIRERRLGNRNVEIVFSRFQQYASEVIKLTNSTEAASSRCYDNTTAISLMSELNAQWLEEVNE